ncbi:MAG: HEAT repeat domain-containing protein, partial [Planctomycetales bacterium]
CRTETASHVLRAGLSDEDIDVQIECCRAWGRWGTSESAQLLGQVILNDRAELDVKLAAVKALSTVSQPTSIAALAPALEKMQNPAIQHQAVLSLQKLTKKDFGNDLVAWRNFVDNPSAAVASGNSNQISLAEQIFWWVPR